MGSLLSQITAKLLGGGPICESECSNVRCCTTTQGVYDPSRWPPPERPRQVSEESAASEFSARPTRFLRRLRKRVPMSTTVYIDSRKRVAGTDSDFEIDLGETLHIDSGAKLAVHKIRVADAFLSTDRGSYLYWHDVSGGTLHNNYAAATYVASTNEIQVAYDGNRVILNNQDLRLTFPNGPGYPPGVSSTRPESINHLLGPSFISGAQQIFTFTQMAPYESLYLRCPALAAREHILGPLGSDIIAKIIVDRGVGHVLHSRTDEGHFVNLHGPITLRYLRFRLTDLDGEVVNTRGTSVSFAIYLNWS